MIQRHFAPQNGDSNPAGFSYIHFVAHGIASRLSPLDSAVVLSAPPHAPHAQHAQHAYKLYARDLVRHRLHAQLVTISACYGFGLRAGSHHVISALWEASDASTPQLMDRLYGELERGNAPDVALRNAKLQLIQTTGPFRKPLY